MFHSAARQKILNGTTTLADTVRVTLEPSSKSALTQREWGKSIMCTDAVGITREISLTDPEDDPGSQMLRQAAEKTLEALEEGISPGCGLALQRCIPKRTAEERKTSGDERNGLEIPRCALSVPTRQIAAKSAVDGGVEVARMLKSKGAIGFDALHTTYVDLVAEGNVDPTKVARVAIENAVSVVSVLLLTEATMTDIPAPSKEEDPEVGH